MIMGLNHYRAASIAKLREVKLDCSPSKVRAIWAARSYQELEKAWPAVVELDYYKSFHRSFRACKRRAVCAAAGFYDVGYIGEHKESGLDVYYCNAGDTYAPTIVFHGPLLHVATWGDYAESGKLKFPPTDEPVWV